MKAPLTVILLVYIFLVSCKSGKEKEIRDGVAYEYYSDGVIKSETEVSDTLANGLMKNYDRDGNISSVYTFVMGKRHGPAVTYYPSGKIKLKMFYSDGKREGKSQWFYNTGELYRDIPYKNGKIDGIRTSYYKNGSVMALAPYREGMPGLGLQEFDIRGEPVEEDVRLIIEEENRLFADNTFILHLMLSERQPGSNFFMGELTDGKYLNRLQWKLPDENGEAKFRIHLDKGRFRMEKLIFSVSYQTKYSNYRVLTRSYNLAIDNK
jgi:hypothetical protein